MYSVLKVSKLKLYLNSELELKLKFDSKWAKLDQYCDNIGKIEQVNQRLNIILRVLRFSRKQNSAHSKILINLMIISIFIFFCLIYGIFTYLQQLSLTS